MNGLGPFCLSFDFGSGGLAVAKLPLSMLRILFCDGRTDIVADLLLSLDGYIIDKYASVYVFLCKCPEHTLKVTQWYETLYPAAVKANLLGMPGRSEQSASLCGDD